MNDNEFTVALVEAIRAVTRLMNEAKARGKRVEFNIPETEMMGKNEAGEIVCLRREFRELVWVNGTLVAA